MILQAKNLKALLIECDIPVRPYSLTGKHSVETMKRYYTYKGKRFYEYGNAKSQTGALTEEQIKLLKEKQPYIKIRNYPQYQFAIIEL